MAKKFDKKMVKQIAKEYLFTNTSYKKLGNKYNCSSSTISYLMNYDLLETSRVLYILVALKAKHAQTKAMKKYFS